MTTLKYFAGLSFLISANTLSAAAADDSPRGEDVFKACVKCHKVGNGAQHGKGPRLNGILDRKAGTQPGYKSYSKALKKAGQTGLVWNIANLDAYLANPKGFVRGTSMRFKGLGKQGDRAAVITYLQRFSNSQDSVSPRQRSEDSVTDPKQ